MNENSVQMNAQWTLNGLSIISTTALPLPDYIQSTFKRD